MKTIKEWTKQHLVTSWAIASGVFAVLIHILYAIPAPCDFLENKWGAGDILTYASTVALGLLAVWQNQRFKEEGDKAQADAEIQHKNAQNELRQIIRHNNEINTISHITDVELQYINRVEQSCIVFYNACSIRKVFEAILNAQKQDYNKRTNASIDIRDTYTLFSSHIGGGFSVVGLPIDEIRTTSKEFYTYVMSMIEHEFDTVDTTNKNVQNSYFEKWYTALNTTLAYLQKRRQQLNKILADNKSLEEVRAIYRVNLGDTNEQTET